VLKSKEAGAQAKMEAADLLDTTDIDHGPIAAAVAFVILLGLMLMYSPRLGSSHAPAARDAAVRSRRCFARARLGRLGTAGARRRGHGARPARPAAVNAAMLGAGAFTATFFGLRGVGHPWLAGSLAVIAAVLGTLFGAIAKGLGHGSLGGRALRNRVWRRRRGPQARLGSGGRGGREHRPVRRDHPQRKLEVLLPPVFAAAFRRPRSCDRVGPALAGSRALPAQ